MKRQGLMARLLDKLQWRPLQVYLRHYRSAEIDISTIAVAYYLILTVFPLIVIAANVFPYLNIDTTDLLKFMNEHLPKQFYAPAANVVQDIFSTPSGQLLGVASLTGFWTMIKSLSSLQKAINKVYGASEHRDVFISHIIGGFMSLVILFLLTFALMLSTIIQSVLRVVNQTYPIGSKYSTSEYCSCLPGNDGALFRASECEDSKNPLCYARDYLYDFSDWLFKQLVWNLRDSYLESIG